MACERHRHARRRRRVRTRGRLCRETDKKKPLHDGAMVQTADPVGRRKRLETAVRIALATDVNGEVRVCRRTRVPVDVAVSRRMIAV